MSEVTGWALIQARLDSGYTGDWSIYWPNTVNQAPDPDTDDVEGYLRAVIHEAAPFQADTNGSGGTFRHPGQLVVSIFTLRGIGVGSALALGDTLAALFRGKKEASGTTEIIYRTPNVRAVGSDGQWYQTDVEVPFERDTQHTTT